MLNDDSKPTPKLKQEQKKKLDKQLDQFIDNHGNSLAGKVWRGNTVHQQSKRQNYLNTGFEELNTALHGNGWPLTSMTEIGTSHDGIGELRLLLPALRGLQEKSLQKNIVLVNPPCLPFAPAWEKEGIQIDRLTIVKTNSIQDTLWSTEQSINAGCCAAVLAWTGRYNLNTQELRRLQLVTEKNQTWNIIFRHSRCLEQSSVSGLRLQIKANAYSQLSVDILKQPNGWGGQHCELSLHPHYENWRKIPVSLLPHSNTYQPAQTSVFPTNATQTNTTKVNSKPQRVRLESGPIKSAKVTLLSAYSALKVVH